MGIQISLGRTESSPLLVRVGGWGEGVAKTARGNLCLESRGTT